MKIILALSVMMVVGTIGAGIVCMMRGAKADVKQLKLLLRANSFIVAPLMLIAIALMVPEVVLAAGTDAATGLSSGAGFGLIASGLSTGLACLGAGYAVGAVGSSAIGAVAEDASVMGKTLIFVGLAEGIAIYGLIISIMIMNKL